METKAPTNKTLVQAPISHSAVAVTLGTGILPCGQATQGNPQAFGQRDSSP